MPQEIVCQIFVLLPRKDRLSFTLVCPEWMHATDIPTIWKKLSVIVNEDFIEPSLIYLTQRYFRYIKVLEIGWNHPMRQNSTIPQLRHKEIVKRVGRLFVLLFERLVQIQHLVISNWHDIYHLKKLSYLLLRFIKYQCNLQSITLNNANLYDMNFANILIGCLRSKSAVKHINLHYTTYNSRKLFDSWVFTNCMELFYNLETLSIDCWIFWQFFNKLQVRYCRLRQLNLYLDDSMKKFDNLITIRETQWQMFFVYLPRATVNLKVEKPMNDEQFRTIIQKFYPLFSFTWTYPYPTETCQFDCNQCLERLTNLQYGTLEYIHLNLPLEMWHLKDKISYIKRKCKNVRSFIFNDIELIEK